ncbi:MAG: hypothetical protein KDA60_20800, partial [Planctomycetales bacterium]|nr:hypothetical protein [Planctomycetales bacterium]
RVTPRNSRGRDTPNPARSDAALGKCPDESSAERLTLTRAEHCRGRYVTPRRVGADDPWSRKPREQLVTTRCQPWAIAAAAHFARLVR